MRRTLLRCLKWLLLGGAIALTLAIASAAVLSDLRYAPPSVWWLDAGGAEMPMSGMARMMSELNSVSAVRTRTFGARQGAGVGMLIVSSDVPRPMTFKEIEEQRKAGMPRSDARVATMMFCWIDAGWPCPVLEARWPNRTTTFLMMSNTDAERHLFLTPKHRELVEGFCAAHLAQPLLIDVPWTSVVESKPLPCSVNWWGLMVNASLYGGLLWSCVGGIASLRRSLRRRRGQCTGCGYDLVRLPICPECGKRAEPSVLPS